MHTGPRAWSDKLLSRPVAFLHIHCLSHSPAVTRRPYSFVGVHFFLHDVKARAAGADDIVRIQLFVAHVVGVGAVSLLLSTRRQRHLAEPQLVTHIRPEIEVLDPAPHR